MTSSQTHESSVSFVPSRVQGLSGVQEVSVFPDRIELRGEQGWTVVRYEAIAGPPEQPTVFERLFGVLDRPTVLGIHFSRERYPDSYVRLMTDPPVTLYMPADGPTQFPDSAFARILRAIAAGAYGYHDLDGPATRRVRPDPSPHWLRTLWQAVVLACVINFVAIGVVSIFLGGSALEGTVENGHYYLNRPGRRHRPEVSAAVWNFSWWQGMTALSGIGVVGAVSVAAAGCSAVLRRQRMKATTTTSTESEPDDRI